jgi:hypothetical protein
MNSNAFKAGLKDGVPIGLGYFAVSFSLGIIAKKAGLSAIQGFFCQPVWSGKCRRIRGFCFDGGQGFLS